MPKLLNVAKLEKKFATLTKSRDSIQHLSHWIIQHKQNYLEIVEEWFNVLKKCDDANIITVFYVANDVIQNCGKKGAPEYRSAFSPILEQAVTLEKVKFLKDEILRMISLWCDRGIYSTEFFQQLKSILEQSVSSLEDTSGDSEELSDSEILSSYKLQDLVDSVEKMRALQKQLMEKQTLILSSEPEEPNFDNLIVRMDGHQVYKKFEDYNDKLEEYMKLAQKAVSTSKKVLKYLNYSNTFYCVQNSEVKKVAQAYKLYGKKLTSMVEKLSEKQKELKCDEPSLEDDSSSVLECELTSSKSFISEVSPVDLEENSNASASTSKMFQSPVTETSNQSLISCSNVDYLEDERIKKKSSNVEESVPLSLENMQESSRSPLIQSAGTNLNKNTVKVKIEDSPLPAPVEHHTDLTANVPTLTKPDSSENDTDEVDSLLEAGFTNKLTRKNVGIKRKIHFMFKAESQKSKKIATDTAGSEVKDNFDGENCGPSISNTNSDDKIKGGNNLETSSSDAFNKDIPQSSQVVQSIVKASSEEENCSRGIEVSDIPNIDNPMKTVSIPGLDDKPMKTISIPGLDDFNINVSLFEDPKIKLALQDGSGKKSETFLNEAKMLHPTEGDSKTSDNSEVLSSLNEMTTASICENKNSTGEIINSDATPNTVIHCDSVANKVASTCDTISDLNAESACKEASTPMDMPMENPSIGISGIVNANDNDVKDSVSQSSVHTNHSNLLENLKALAVHLSKPNYSSFNSKVEKPGSDATSSIPVMPLNSLFTVLSCVLSSSSKTSPDNDSKLKGFVEKKKDITGTIKEESYDVNRNLACNLEVTDMDVDEDSNT